VRVKQGRRATLDEVAERAGVSPSTVSRVVRGSTPVSEELEKAVRDAIRATGYIPNLAARQLVTSRSDTVGVVIPEDQLRVFGDPFFLELLQGVAAHLATTRFHLVMMMGRTAEDSEWLMHYVGGGHIDGVMLIAPGRRGSAGKVIAQAGVPVIYLGKPFSGSRAASFVDADNVGGIKQAVEYLYARDRRHIAMVTGIPSMRSAVDRTVGYRRGLASVGLPLDEDLILPTDYTKAGGELAMDRLLQSGRPVDAVIAASDLVATGVLHSLQRAGIKVPADIAVIGFGDDWIAAQTDPPLTTISQDAVQMGRKLAELTVNAIEGRPGPLRFIMPTRLVLRATT
jgi:DNA-binding LacI/PurR family transcriptional regulator